jgi:predicted transcriptional regulator
MNESTAQIREVKPYVVNATTRLDLDVLQEIDALATELNSSRSKVIAGLIADGISNMKA